MLVYGRQEYQARLGTVLQHLATRAARTRADSLDDLRMLLIQTGQLEQGVEDSPEMAAARRLVQSVNQLTEQAALLFLRAWSDTNPSLAVPPVHSTRRLADFCAELRALQGPHTAALTIKMPEGFEYYALFPEQYCVSALRWAADHAGTWPKRAAVIGIRSIGTSLSALVAAVLSAQGWQVQRRTVRPTGHPFAREVTLDGADFEACPCAVIVDEGPGLSGSSMAATARALAETGIRDLSFLPGHAGAPGSAATPETRQWWAETPCYVTGLEDLRWSGLTIPQLLATRSRQLRREKAASEGETVEDLSAGLWRQRAFPNGTNWPAALARFERTKYLCPAANGAALLWKFAGLGCAWPGGKTSLELALEQMAARVQSRLVPEVLESFRGFIATPWIEGTRLSGRDLQDPAVLAHAGHYLCQSAGQPLDGQEAHASLARLKEMLYANTRESLGEAAAEQTRIWAKGLRPSAPIASYGDGRLAPHEWVRTPTGALLKTDPTGHDLDHTLVGKQPLLWDLAGLLVEWDLSPKAAAPLLCSVSAAGIPVPPEALAFYQMSYAAFRLGMTTLCAGELPPGSEEWNRLERASAAYRGKLEPLLKALPRIASANP